MQARIWRNRSVGVMAAALVAAAMLFSAAVVRADVPVLGKSAIVGDPGIKSIDTMTVTKAGELIIGDGRGNQVVVIDAGDATKRAGKGATIEHIDRAIAQRLGAGEKGIEILDMAVNPASGRAYLAVRKHDDKQDVVITVDPDGTIGMLDLRAVKHARLGVPEGLRITNIVYSGDKVIAAARANDQFTSRIFVATAPVQHEAEGSVYAAETYHVSHGRWETKAPMSAMVPYQEDGKTYIVGAFSCTPVVKFPLDSVEAGANVKGISMIELGSGNRPIDIISYRRDGRASVLINNNRFHHERAPYGPSPFWTVRFDQDLLAGNEPEKVNEKAVHRTKGMDPRQQQMEIIEPYFGVTRMDQLDNDRALVLRVSSDGKGVDMLPLALP